MPPCSDQMPESRLRHHEVIFLTMKSLMDYPSGGAKAISCSAERLKQDSVSVALKWLEKRQAVVKDSSNGYTLTDYGRELYRTVDRCFEMDRLYSPLGCRIIICIGKGDVTTGFLDRKMKSQQRVISNYLTKLRRQEVVVSERDPKDKRVYYHRLNTKGLAVYAQITGEKEEKSLQTDFKEIFVGVDDDGLPEKQLSF